MDEAGNAIGAAMLVGLVAMIALFVFFEEPASPWPDTSNGAVVTVRSAEHTHVTADGRPVQITHGGNTLVMMLSDSLAAFAELVTVLCGGGVAIWIVLAVIALLALAGIGAGR